MSAASLIGRRSGVDIAVEESVVGDMGKDGTVQEGDQGRYRSMISALVL